MDPLATRPDSDPVHVEWMDLVARHAEWIAKASAELEGVPDDPEAAERAITRWTRIGHSELGPEINLLSLLSCVRLAVVPSGTAADARLRRRRSLSEAAYGAVLRAQQWQSGVLYLCPGIDGLLLVRLHFRTLAILEKGDWPGTALDAAKWVVVDFVVSQGLTPDPDLPVPSMEDVQRRAFSDLRQGIAALFDPIAGRGGLLSV